MLPEPPPTPGDPFPSLQERLERIDGRGNDKRLERELREELPPMTEPGETTEGTLGEDPFDTIEEITEAAGLDEEIVGVGPGYDFDPETGRITRTWSPGQQQI